MPVFRPKQSERFDVELAAAHVNVAARRFAERHDAGIEAMDKRAKGDEVQGAGRTDVEAVHG
jgi:hypothetical protein